MYSSKTVAFGEFVLMVQYYIKGMSNHGAAITWFVANAAAKAFRLRNIQVLLVISM